MIIIVCTHLLSLLDIFPVKAKTEPVQEAVEVNLERVLDEASNAIDGRFNVIPPRILKEKSLTIAAKVRRYEPQICKPCQQSKRRF